MGRNNWFEFKQFRIEQKYSAMKVGTDGVLLGAWAPVGNARHILDVGTGTGLVALMLGQRCLARIDGVEIDPLACEEARYNFGKSPWNDRLTAIHADFHPFAQQHPGTYDLIVSNPPFFVNSLKSKDKAAAAARHNDALTFYQLISGAAMALREGGSFCVIIPFESSREFRELARLEGFFLAGETLICPRKGKIHKRVLLEFSAEPCYPTENEIVILNEDGSYTGNFKSLTAPFYPAF